MSGHKHSAIFDPLDIIRIKSLARTAAKLAKLCHINRLPVAAIDCGRALGFGASSLGVAGDRTRGGGAGLSRAPFDSAVAIGVRTRGGGAGLPSPGGGVLGTESGLGDGVACAGTPTEKIDQV